MKLETLKDIPVLPDDPIEKVKAALTLTGNVEVIVPANQLAFIVHALYVGLSHPQFDYSDKAEAIELLAEQWSQGLESKAPGLKPLFEADRGTIEFARKARRNEMMPTLPGKLGELKKLAKKLGIKGYFAMNLEEILSEIENFPPEMISESLNNGEAD
jgi:hypothetical protein